MYIQHFASRAIAHRMKNPIGASKAIRVLALVAFFFTGAPYFSKNSFYGLETDLGREPSLDQAWAQQRSSKSHAFGHSKMTLTCRSETDAHQVVEHLLNMPSLKQRKLDVGSEPIANLIKNGRCSMVEETVPPSFHEAMFKHPRHEMWIGVEKRTAGFVVVASFSGGLDEK